MCSRGIGPLDPAPAAGHAEDENRRRGNARARTSMGDGSNPGVRRKKVNPIEHVRDNPVRRALVSRAVDWP